jgi:uncharacterized protein involved in exopolysaccharide biosynthesis
MSELLSSEPTSDARLGSPSSERVVCVIARDVLPLERRETGFSQAFLTAVWKGRWLVLVSVLAFGLLFTAYALFATQWFLAQAVLTPSSPQNPQGLAGQLEGFGALAGLAGLNVGLRNTDEPIAVLKSRDFAQQFIEEQGLLHVLLWEGWDAQAGHWRETDPQRQPDIRDAVSYFDKNVLQVQEDRKTRLVTVGIRWTNPTVAALWANAIVDHLNQQMRARALTESEANIAYLQKGLTTNANQVAVQQAIARLLETELQKVMIARGVQGFSFRIVDHAAVPRFRDWPKRTIIVAIGILFGGFLGLFAVFVREAITAKPADRLSDGR